jgi:deoxyribonuclease-4
VRIGAHIPVAGGPARAVRYAREVGCEAVQVFVSNPRGWAPPRADPARDERFRAGLAAAGIGPLFVHASYMVNFATVNDAFYERSRSLVAVTLERAAGIGAAGVVVHAGQAMGGGRERGLARSRAALLALVESDGPDLVLELTAGTKGALAARFDEMAELLAACDEHPRLKVCLDTCHAHAAGYDVASEEGVAATLGELTAALDGRLVLVHANDSLDARGARRDRHWHVGEGQIGETGFRALLAHPALAETAVVVETPGDLESHARDVARLKAWRP